MDKCEQCGHELFDNRHRYDDNGYDHPFVAPNLEAKKWKAKADKLAKALEMLLIEADKSDVTWDGGKAEKQARAALAEYRE
jgi:hypothetical protein